MTQPTPLAAYAGPLVALCNDLVRAGIKEATGKNDGLPSELFAGGREGEAWCAHFVAWAFRTIELPIPGDVVPTRKRGNPLAAVKVMLAVFADRAWLTQSPRPGDVMFSSRGGNNMHVGIVVETDSMGRFVHCVEGNARDALRRVVWSRANSSILVYGRRPDYGDSLDPPTEGIPDDNDDNDQHDDT